MQPKPHLNLYSSLGNLPWLKKSYTAKIMVVAFLGTHVPLLTLLVWFLTSNAYSVETSVRVLLIALLATLAGTAATLYTLRYLLVPVILTSEALQNYLDTRTLPNLPTEFDDEVGKTRHRKFCARGNGLELLTQVDQIRRIDGRMQSDGRSRPLTMDEALRNRLSE